MEVTITIDPPKFEVNQNVTVIADWQKRGQTGIVQDMYYAEARLSFKGGQLVRTSGHWNYVVKLASGETQHFYDNQIA